MGVKVWGLCRKQTAGAYCNFSDKQLAVKSWPWRYYPSGGLGYIGVEEKDEYIYNDNGWEIRSEMIKAAK